MCSHTGALQTNSGTVGPYLCSHTGTLQTNSGTIGPEWLGWGTLKREVNQYYILLHFVKKKSHEIEKKFGLLNPPFSFLFSESAVRAEACIVVLVTSTVRGRNTPSRIRGALTAGCGQPTPPVPETPGCQMTPVCQVQGEHAGVPARPSPEERPDPWRQHRRLCR